VYLEEQPDKVSALKRERAIKTLSRPQKKKLVHA
jgi:predicted GIY-YIG superfamily endonuclease